MQFSTVVIFGLCAVFVTALPEHRLDIRGLDLRNPQCIAACNVSFCRI
jgi:hypothetical protein